MKLEEESKEVMEKAHLVDKRQSQVLPLMVAFTNVLETFKGQEHAQRKRQLKGAWLAALVLANFMEGNAGKAKNLLVISI